MKKELIYYSLLTLVIALLLFFETNLFNDNTDFVSKVIEVEAFEKLDIDIDCNIYVSLGDEQKVVFEGPANYLKKVETHMENGVLKISCKKPGMLAELFGADGKGSESVNVYIKLTNANQLIMPEKGNLISNEALQFLDRKSSNLFSLNTNLRHIIKLIGNQLSHIKLR